MFLARKASLQFTERSPISRSERLFNTPGFASRVCVLGAGVALSAPRVHPALFFLCSHLSAATRSSNVSRADGAAGYSRYRSACDSAGS